MAFRNYGVFLEQFAQKHGLELLEVSGQTAFAVYGMSGGLCSTYIAYFRKPDSLWPSGDFGREGRSPDGVVAIEFDPHWSDNELTAHFAKRIEAEGVTA